MASNPKHSTDDAHPLKFRPHGRVEMQIDGNVVRHIAYGPFNEELIIAYADIDASILSEMAGKGRWVVLSEIKDSALASPQTLHEYTRYLKEISARGVAPCATALVIAPGVEGARIMTPMLIKCYADAGIPFRIFEQSEEAKAWVQSMLNDG